MAEWLEKLGCHVERPRFKSHLGQDWKPVNVHPEVNGYLTIVADGICGERRGLGTDFHMP